MSNDVSLREILQAVFGSATLTAMSWGAFGGATAAVAVKVERRAVIRQIVLGGMFAGGVGAGGGALLSGWLDIDLSSVPVAALGGTASYLLGLFGPAIVELMLSRLSAAKAKVEGEPND